MNVLENLNVDKASILRLKEGDILFVQLREDTNSRQINEIAEGFRKAITKIGATNITVVASNSIEDVKIIRR